MPREKYRVPPRKRDLLVISAKVNGVDLILVCTTRTMPNMTGRIYGSAPACCPALTPLPPPVLKSMRSVWTKRFQKKRSSALFHNGADVWASAWRWKLLVISIEYEKYIGPTASRFFQEER